MTTEQVRDACMWTDINVEWEDDAEASYMEEYADDTSPSGVTAYTSDLSVGQHRANGTWGVRSTTYLSDNERDTEVVATYLPSRRVAVRAAEEYARTHNDPSAETTDENEICADREWARRKDPMSLSASDGTTFVVCESANGHYIACEDEAGPGFVHERPSTGRWNTRTIRHNLLNAVDEYERELEYHDDEDEEYEP